ncbi:MAG: hypothetical protein PUD24_01205 [Oscillospiraceae bacterium]|nr:hypothetical protein [Oscillospiraceae bacterium]
MKNKRDTINLLFSAFLIIAYIICSYFFSGFASQLAVPMSSIVNALIFVVFGLLVFYATRVGEGKAVKRFSLLTLIVLDLPALYIIVAAIAPGLPFHDALAANGVMMMLAGVALGYGIPYTFLSGFELVTEEIITDMPAVEGGVAEDLKDNAPEAETTYEPQTDEDEIVVEGTNLVAEDDKVQSSTLDEAVEESKDEK